MKKKKTCEYPECETENNLEPYDLNPICSVKRKDISEKEKDLIRRKRKTIILCVKHHVILHKKRIIRTKKN